MSERAPNTGNITDAVTVGDARGVITTKQKFTAVHIENGCPARLQLIGEEITKRFNEAQEQANLLDDQVIELKKLIAEARALCDVGGFDAFREKFFPNLRKSRVYELLAIATNKKSAEDARATNRERVAKHRAKKAEAPVSVTVMENSEPEAQGARIEGSKNAQATDSETVTENSELEPPEVTAEGGTVEAASFVPKQAPEPVKLRRDRTPGEDEGLRGFSAGVLDLDRRTENKPIGRFAKTNVPADKLARLGKLLTYLANLKKSDAVKPMPTMTLPDNGIVSVEQSAGDMKGNVAPATWAPSTPDDGEMP